MEISKHRPKTQYVRQPMHRSIGVCVAVGGVLRIVKANMRTHVGVAVSTRGSEASCTPRTDSSA